MAEQREKEVGLLGSHRLKDIIGDGGTQGSDLELQREDHPKCKGKGKVPWKGSPEADQWASQKVTEQQS